MERTWAPAARATCSERLWSVLYELTGDQLRRRLDGLLVVPEGGRVSELDRLRTKPRRAQSVTRHPLLVAPASAPDQNG
ncbi:MAG: hypothetical protein M3137_07165 [Actinomycetota bacterium]|nr:hypothetical protein [Actinomycetota bacterium]